MPHGIGYDKTGENALLSMSGALGTVFYVDGTSGVDTNGGLTKDDPLLTITAAIGKCTNDKGDVIQILRNSPSAPPGTETFPIVVNKSNITIRGTLGKGMLSDSGFGSDVTDGHCITLAANFVTIENLYLGIKDGGTPLANVIMATQSCYSFTLRNCLIEAQYRALYGLYSGTQFDLPYLLVEDCVFGGNHTYGNFTSAIRLHNATRGVIRRNVFRSCTSYSIHLEATCEGGTDILDNKFRLFADTDGGAVFCAQDSVNNFIDGNHAAHGIDDPANDPFWQESNDDDNDFGLNYKGKSATNGIGA